MAYDGLASWAIIEYTINMRDVLKFIQNILSTTQITDLLALNAPFHNPKGAKNKTNSIIPVPFASPKTSTPFLTVQEGVSNKLGKKLFDETIYIRVYNSKSKAYYEIDQIAEEIIDLIDEQVYDLDNHTMIRAKYESMLASATDEALDMNFRELRFRIIML